MTLRDLNFRRARRREDGIRPEANAREKLGQTGSHTATKECP